MNVFFTSLAGPQPVFHTIPDWHSGEGRKGDEVTCNTHVYASTDNVIGSNGGIPLPEEIVAPCGILVFRRMPIEDRSEPWGGTQVLNKTRMVLQGQEIPHRHAKKFGRPCVKCFPGK